MMEPEDPRPAAGNSDKNYNLSGDFRGAIINIESTFVGAKQAQDVEGLPPEPGDAPYKGLQYFDEADADHFLGRELLTARVAGRLHQSTFLAVIGASGSGKSSLVRAGVVPALKRGRPLADGALPPAGSAKWAYCLITPTAHPLDALAGALTREGASVADASALAAQLTAEPHALALAARQLLGREGRDRLFLVIDQFEEVFSLCKQPEERKAFFDALIDATGEGNPITVLIALRADFYARFAEHDGLREKISRNQEYIGAMSREELFRAIVEPAARGDWKIQEGLVELMLDDAGDEPGALPLLSHALLETWSRRRGRTMTLSAYRESGGVRGAIAKTAETVFQQRLTPEQRPVARAIFVRLTELGESDLDTPDTRRRALFSELITRSTDPQTLNAVLDILISARLVTTDVVHPGDTQVVEVAHEALIREWPTLQGWLDQDREGLIRHRELTRDVNDWIKLGKDKGALYRGARLEQTLAWTADSPDPLSLTEQEFLDASKAAVAREGRDRALRWALAGLAVLAVAVAAFFYLSRNNTEEAGKMTGDFNIAVAEFAVLDANGKLTNEAHNGGEQIAARIGGALQEEFSGRERDDIQVAYDGQTLANGRKLDVGVVGDPALGAADPAEAAETLNADMVIYGFVQPDGEANRLTLRFFMTPQYGANLGDLVGNFESAVHIPVFDPTDPDIEVWRDLDPVANSLAWLALGMRQEILGEQEDALASFQQAAEFAPESDIIQYFIGQEHIYLAQRSVEAGPRELAAAEAAFTRALELNPTNARARIGQGSVHFIRAQNMLSLATDQTFTGDVPQAMESIALEAQAALTAYSDVAAKAEQVETYGVPAASIARLGQGISYRLLGETAFRLDDPTSGETLIDQGIAAIETDIARLDTANDPRLAAQTYQALGSLYEWKAFFLEQSGKLDDARAARETAIAYYEDCRQQGNDFPVDTYMVEHIVRQLCAPRIDALRPLVGGG